MSARNHRLSPARQAANLCIAWPSFKCRVSGTGVRCEGMLQPTPISASYSIVVEFRRYRAPRAWVKTPILTVRSEGEAIPHVDPDARVPGGYRPCLGVPNSGEYTTNETAHCQLIPWLAEWLFHYEMWHMTGVWSGGGKHHESTEKSS